MKVINSIIAGLLITSLAASACTRCDETAVSPSNYGELCTVSVRYKAPDSDESSLIEYPITDNGISNECDFDFICGVIETSMDLRDSDYKGNATYDSAYELAYVGCDNDPCRVEFCNLLTAPAYYKISTDI